MEVSDGIYFPEAEIGEILGYALALRCVSYVLMTLLVTGCNIVVWGALLMLQASTTSFGAFFALRFLLGET